MSALSKLVQKPHIPLKKQLNIIHPILQQRDPVRAHAKRKSRDLSRVIPIVFHKLKHIRIDHAASQNLNPSRLLARTARIVTSSATAATNKARHKHLRARLGKRKKRWTKTRLHARPKKLLHRVIERPLQISESNIGVDRQSFDLMKHRRVARVRRIVAVYNTRNHNAQRRP